MSINLSSRSMVEVYLNMFTDSQSSRCLSGIAAVLFIVSLLQCERVIIPVTPVPCDQRQTTGSDTVYSTKTIYITNTVYTTDTITVTDTVSITDTLSLSDTVYIAITVNATKPHEYSSPYNAYYGHFHNHTILSDGSGTPRQAYTYAREVANLDFFGISDHGMYLDSAKWKLMKATADSCNADSLFVALWGFEWTSSVYGHCTIVGSEEYCTANDTSTNTFDKLCSWLASHNAYAFFNHPGRSGASQEFNRFTGTPSYRFVGMELWNKSDGFNRYYYNDGFYTDDHNKSYYDEALSRGWHIGAAGSGDNHTASWGTYVDYRLAILAPACTRKDITEALTARRFYSTLDKNISLSFSADSSEMGATVSGCTHTLAIQAMDGDNEAFTEVVLFNGNHIPIVQWKPNSNLVDLHCEVSVTDNDYFYVKIKQADGDEAISSPIRVVCGGNSDFQ